jgi:NAD(P)H-dependent FMN reductase
MTPTDPIENPIMVVAICGSLRRGSYTRSALTIALQGAQEVGAQTRLIDLQEYQLVLCGKEDESAYPEDVFRLRREVGRAQGIILGTPEYHGSFSGVLKNALDLMGFDEFEGKMIGLVGVSGGALGAVHALSGLRTVGRALHAWVIPEHVSIPEAYKAFDESGNLKDSDLEKRVKEVGRRVARFAYLHTSEEAQGILSAWERARMNPGAQQVSEADGGLEQLVEIITN